MALVLAGAVASAAADGERETPPTRLHIEVTTSDGTVPSSTPRGILQLIPMGGQEEEVLELAFDGSGSYSTSVSPRSIWQVRARADGHWAPEAIAVAGGPAAVIPLYPAGELGGRLTVPPNVSRPDEVDVELGPPPAPPGRDRAEPTGRVRCPVDQDGWRCSLPLGTFDLRLHAPGFASVLLWDVTVEAGEGVLGPAVSLAPGAAVLGRVEIDGEGRLEETAIELRPAGSATRDPETGGRLGQLFRTARPDERGFFQFQDVTPGIYRIEAWTEGGAAAAREPVEVFPGRELDLVAPLVVTAPSELVVAVEPPVPPGEAGGWNVQLRALDGSNQSHNVVADPTGVAQIAFAPGWYRLAVRDEHSTWLAEEIELSPGKAVRNVELPLVAIEGTVRRGDEPQRALLGFGGVLPRAEEVRFLSGPDGAFSGHLPGEGEWPLSVQLEPGGSKHRLDPIEVVRRPGEDVVRVEIELPNTLAEGIVVDAAGRPVSLALVLAWQEGSHAGRSETKTDAEGGFRFSSLPPGAWVIEAFSMSRSGRVQLDLTEGEQAEVEIRLSDDRAVEGRVVSDWGPVAGALVYAVPEVPRTTPLSPWRTDPLGAFTARVPADATGVHLLVLALGRPARLEWVPLPPEGDVYHEIELPWAGAAGTLSLDLPPPGTGRVELRRGSARVPIYLLQEWSSMHGIRLPRAGRWTVGDMEAGPWEICQADRCEAGFLLPADELELSLASAERVGS